MEYEEFGNAFNKRMKIREREEKEKEKESVFCIIMTIKKDFFLFQ